MRSRMQTFWRSAAPLWLEVCDEADSCREAIRTRIERHNENCFKDGLASPACLSETLDVGFLHVRWVSRQLIGESKQFHNFGFDLGALIVKRQLPGHGLVDAHPA